jgi:hypothetical protein
MSRVSQRPAWTCLHCLLILVLLTGCSWFASDEIRDPSLEITAEIGGAEYRAGEAVLVHLTIANTGAIPQMVQRPDARSVRFLLKRLGEPEDIERRAVASEDEPLGDQVELAPGERIERRMLFTRVTQYVGPMLGQIHYRPYLFPPPNEPPKVYSEPFSFTVTEPLLFHRDSAGLIEKPDAIALASAATTGTVIGSEAIMSIDERGFLKWWVNLAVVPEATSSIASPRSWFVDPYLGRVWAEAEPFPSEWARDPRIQPTPARFALERERLRREGSGGAP